MNVLYYVRRDLATALPPKGPFRKILRLFEVKINFLAPRLNKKNLRTYVQTAPLYNPAAAGVKITGIY